MRLLIEQDDGTFVELKELDKVSDSSQIIVLMCQCRLNTKTLDHIMDHLREVTGKRFIILGPEFTKAFGV